MYLKICSTLCFRDWCKKCHIQLAKIFSGNVHSVLHRFFMQTFSSGLEMKIDR